MRSAKSGMRWDFGTRRSNTFGYCPLSPSLRVLHNVITDQVCRPGEVTMLNAQTHPNSKVVQNVSSALNSLLADMIALVRRPSFNSNSVAQADRAALTRRLR